MVSRMWHRSYTICSYMLALCNSRPKFLLPQLNGVVPLGVKSSLSMSMLLAFFWLSAVIRNSSSMKHWSPSPHTNGNVADILRLPGCADIYQQSGKNASLRPERGDAPPCQPALKGKQIQVGCHPFAIPRLSPLGTYICHGAEYTLYRSKALACILPIGT